MLEIRTKRSEKKGVRVDIFRRYRLTDESEKIKYTYKQIGSFSLHDGYDPSLLEYLEPDEVLQLKNWLAETAFAEKLADKPEELEKFNLRLPQKLSGVLTKLYIEAKRADIDFIPSEVMLEALLKRAALVESMLDKVNGFKSNILQDAGIHYERENPKKVFTQEDRALFKALLELNQPIGKTCSELEEAALALGKNRNVPPPQIKEWAGLIPGRNLEKPVKNWAYIIAIDVLLKNGVNPCSILAPEKIAHYWAIPKTQTLALDAAIKEFEKLFKPSQESKNAVKTAIENIYKTPASGEEKKRQNHD